MPKVAPKGHEVKDHTRTKDDVRATKKIDAWRGPLSTVIRETWAIILQVVSREGYAGPVKHDNGFQCKTSKTWCSGPYYGPDNWHTLVDLEIWHEISTCARKILQWQEEVRVTYTSVVWHSLCLSATTRCHRKVSSISIISRTHHVSRIWSRERSKRSRET